MYIYKNIYICVFFYQCKYRRTQTYICLFICIQICIYTYTYTYIYIHTRTQSQAGIGGVDSWGSLPLMHYRLTLKSPIRWAFAIQPFGARNINKLPSLLEKSRKEQEKKQVLQCVAVCCNVWQGVAVCCKVLQCAAVCCRVLLCVAVCCSVQCVVCCSVLQCAAMCWEHGTKM